jgi:hypothetical protein
MAPPMSPCPSVMMLMNAARSRLSAIARRISGFSKGGIPGLISRVRLMPIGTSSQIASGIWLFTSRSSGTSRL